MRNRTVLALSVALCACAAGAQTSNAPTTPSKPAVPGASAASIDPQKATDIRRLMEITGAAGLGLQMMRSMETVARSSLESALPAGEYRAKLIDLFFEKFRSKLTGDTLIALVVPVYDKHYSDDEIKQLIAFYETPIGKRTVTEMPQVLAESQQVGSKYGETVGRDAMLEVLEEHPELKNALEAAEKSTPSSPVK